MVEAAEKGTNLNIPGRVQKFGTGSGVNGEVLYNDVGDLGYCVGVLDPKAADNVVFSELARNAKLKMNNCSVEV